MARFFFFRLGVLGEHLDRDVRVPGRGADPRPHSVVYFFIHRFLRPVARRGLRPHVCGRPLARGSWWWSEASPGEACQCTRHCVGLHVPALGVQIFGDMSLRTGPIGEPEALCLSVVAAGSVHLGAVGGADSHPPWPMCRGNDTIICVNRIMQHTISGERFVTDGMVHGITENVSERENRKGMVLLQVPNKSLYNIDYEACMGHDEMDYGIVRTKQGTKTLVQVMR